MYIRYLVEKHGLSVLGKNKEGKTPRDIVEQTDKGKYQRVIRNLRNYEK